MHLNPWKVILGRKFIIYKYLWQIIYEKYLFYSYINFVEDKK